MNNSNQTGANTPKLIIGAACVRGNAFENWKGLWWYRKYPVGPTDPYIQWLDCPNNLQTDFNRVRRVNGKLA